MPLFGLLIVGSPGNAPAARVPVNAQAAALATLKRVVVGEHGTSHAPGGQAVQGGFGPKKVTSGDWSGYADNDRSYTAVTARWKEPSVTCGSVESMAAFWVGIDGYGSASVEQAGSLAYCYGGQPYYYTWWEMFPSNAIQIVGNSVQAGDRIDASVATSAIKNGSRYILRVSDTARPGDTFTKYRDCSVQKCEGFSAECVVEAPANPVGGQYPLAHFSSWTAQNVTVKTTGQSGTIRTFPDYAITMKSTAVLAKPGPLNHAGDSFTDTWLKSG